MWLVFAWQRLAAEAPYNADYVGLLDLSSERYEQVDISEAITGDMKPLERGTYRA